MKTSFLSLLVAILALVSCEKQPPPIVHSRPVVAPPPSSGQTGTTPSPSAAVAPGAGTELATPPVIASTGVPATDAAITAYNLDLAAWINSHDTVPKDFNELKAIKGMAVMPTAPPGKRIVYVPNFDRPQWSKIRVE